MDKKINQEKYLVYRMIKIYCRKKHKSGELCQECKEPYKYAAERIDKCPHIQTKTFCSSCKTHCYKPDMREKIKNVMKFSGHRMFLYSPKAAIKHIIDTLKNKKMNKYSCYFLKICDNYIIHTKKVGIEKEIKQYKRLGLTNYKSLNDLFYEQINIFKNMIFVIKISLTKL